MSTQSTVRHRYLEIVRLTTDNPLTAIDLAEQLGTKASSTYQALFSWTRVGAFSKRREQGSTRVLFKPTPRALSPEVVTKALPQAKAMEVLRQLGQTPGAPMPPALARVAPQAPTAPPQASPRPSLPSHLFGGTFTPDGLLIPWDQAHRVIALLAMMTEEGQG